MNNPFAAFNIDHLSPSSLIKYRAEPANWVAHYLFGIRDNAGPKAWVGNAVEAGLHSWLHAESIPAALARANDEFEINAKGIVNDENDKARSEIAPMLNMAMAGLLGRGGSRPLYQVKVEHWVDGVTIPLIGFCDMVWQEPAEEIIDLKTTRSLPSAPRPDHVEQVAFYCRARNCDSGALLYATTKKFALYRLSRGDMDAAYDRLARTARAVQTFLSLLPSRDVAAEITVPDYSHYYWSAETREAAAKIWK